MNGHADIVDVAFVHRPEGACVPTVLRQHAAVDVQGGNACSRERTLGQNAGCVDHQEVGAKRIDDRVGFGRVQVADVVHLRLNVSVGPCGVGRQQAGRGPLEGVSTKEAVPDLVGHDIESVQSSFALGVPAKVRDSLGKRAKAFFVDYAREYSVL